MTHAHTSDARAKQLTQLVEHVQTQLHALGQKH